MPITRSQAAKSAVSDGSQSLCSQASGDSAETRIRAAAARKAADLERERAEAVSKRIDADQRALEAQVKAEIAAVRGSASGSRKSSLRSLRKPCTQVWIESQLQNTNTLSVSGCETKNPIETPARVTDPCSTSMVVRPECTSFPPAEPYIRMLGRTLKPHDDDDLGKMFMATLNSLRPQLRFNPSKPTIENFVFKLHYRMTVVILLTAVVLVCAREYFGEHIRCIADKGVPEHVIKTYCFFMATFTIVRHYNESLLQAGFLPHPGVGPIMESDETLHHTYYQWVPFVLFIQSIMFYLPHYVWKKEEGGRVKALVDGLQLASLALEDDDMTVNGRNIPSKSTIEKRLETIRKDIVLRLRITRTWSTWLVSMEVMNLVNIIFQIWVTNLFLNGHFISLGSRIFDSDWDRIADPLETVFPKVTKCVFHKYGPSGSIQQHDALCVMALNIIHEKIYTVLWFWFLMLFIASVLALIWRLITFVFFRRSLRFNEVLFRQVSSGKFDAYNVIRVVNGCQFGDWLFLYYLAKNMNGFVFQELYSRLAGELAKRELPFDQAGHEKKGAEPVLVGRVDYDDETLPLKGGKSS